MTIRVEDRGGHHIIVWPDGSCRPASDVEKVLHAEIASLRAEVERLTRINSDTAAAVIEAALALENQIQEHVIDACANVQEGGKFGPEDKLWNDLAGAITAHRGEKP